MNVNYPQSEFAGKPCPNCNDIMTMEHSNYVPTWNDGFDDIVCKACSDELYNDSWFEKENAWLEKEIKSWDNETQTPTNPLWINKTKLQILLWFSYGWLAHREKSTHYLSHVIACDEWFEFDEQHDLHFVTAQDKNGVWHNTVTAHDKERKNKTCLI